MRGKVVPGDHWRTLSFCEPLTIYEAALYSCRAPEKPFPRMMSLEDYRAGNPLNKRHYQNVIIPRYRAACRAIEAEHGLSLCDSVDEGALSLCVPR